MNNYGVIGTLILFLFFATFSAAVPGSFFLKVQDCTSQALLSDAQVQMDGASSYSGYSNAYGEYSLDNVQAGSYSLTVSADQFATKSVTASISAGQENVLQVCLKQASDCDFQAAYLPVTCSYSRQGTVSFKVYNPSSTPRLLSYYASSTMPLTSLASQSFSLTAGETKVFPLTYESPSQTTSEEPVIVSLSSQSCRKTLQIPACAKRSGYSFPNPYDGSWYAGSRYNGNNYYYFYKCVTTPY